jgi:hypothetical protein
MYIRREFTDIILKKYQKWCLRIPHHIFDYLLAYHITLCKKGFSTHVVNWSCMKNTFSNAKPQTTLMFRVVICW